MRLTQPAVDYRSTDDRLSELGPVPEQPPAVPDVPLEGWYAPPPPARAPGTAVPAPAAPVPAPSGVPAPAPTGTAAPAPAPAPGGPVGEPADRGVPQQSRTHESSTEDAR